MSESLYSLAIEASGRIGSVSLGRDAQVVETVDLPAERRRAMQLVPTVDGLVRAHRIRPRAIGEIYVSVGPGSFTGLRIAVTTAKALARALRSRLVAVPTLEAVVRNVSPEGRTAVCINAKRGKCYACVFDPGPNGWVPRTEPLLLSPAELGERTPRPRTVICDEPSSFEWPADVTLVDPSLAVPSSRVVWSMGRERAGSAAEVGPATLTPHYVRPPEAEEQRRREKGDA